MLARQNKKRKGRNHVNNRERTVTTFTEDPNTSFLVPLSSEEPPANISSSFSASSFAMPFQNYIPPQQNQFFQPVLPPGKNDLEILENLKSIIKEGQHEFYRAVPQPAALASLYMGHISQPDQLPQEYPSPRFASADDPSGHDTNAQPLTNTVESHTPVSGADTSPTTLSAEALNVPDSNLSSAQPESEDTSRTATQGPPVDTNTDATGEYGARQPADAASPNITTPFDAGQDDAPSRRTGENTWDRRALDDSRKARYDDRNTNLSSGRATSYDNRPLDGAPADAHFPPPEDRRFYDRDRDRDHWDRDRDRHDSIRDFRDRNRDRDVRDRRPEFFGRSYGRSHAPRPPPELRHYEPSYGDDYVPPSRRYDPEDRRGGLRNPSFDDRPKPPLLDDRRPPLDDRRPLPPSSADDDRRLPLDDRPMRRLPNSDPRPLPPSSEDRTRPPADPVPLTRTTAEGDRNAGATSLAADDRPRPNLPLEERLSQPAAAPSLQDRLSQPANAVAPSRVDIASGPSLEERLSSGPVPPRAYQRAASVIRDDLRAPLPKDDPRDHDRINDFKTGRDFSRERATASTYRPDLDRSFGDRDDRDRRDRDVTGIDVPSARYGDGFSRPGPLPPRRYSPPLPMFDRDRERRPYYPPRSPPQFRGEGVYDPDGDRRYATDRERDAYEQRRRDWYGPGDDDKRGPPPASWRPHDRPPFMDRDRERFDRDRDRDLRERERDRDLGGLLPPPPPTRGHWEDRDRRVGFPLSPPHSRMDVTGGVGPGRSLSARLTDPYPVPPGGDDRAYPPPRDFERGRYGGPALDDHGHLHGHAPPPAFSRVRNRSPSLPRRGPGLAEDLRPPVKRVREDNGATYSGVGLGVGGGAVYSPPRRGVGVGVGGGEYAPGPPPSSAATTTAAGVSSVSGTVPARSTGTRTPPVSAPVPGTSTGGAFYERDQRDRERERDGEKEREREREREREYVRGEYGMGYDRDERGRRSPPVRNIGGGGGYGRGVIGDRRDDRRYVPPLPPRTS